MGGRAGEGREVYPILAFTDLINPTMEVRVGAVQNTLTEVRKLVLSSALHGACSVGVEMEA